MRMLVLGAGRMRLSAVHDLVAEGDVTEVTIADYDGGKAEAIGQRYPVKALARQIDCSDQRAVVELMRVTPRRSVVSTTGSTKVWRKPRWRPERISAISAGTTTRSMRNWRSMPTRAQRELMSCRIAGSRPGVVAVLAAHGAEKFEKLESIHIRVGGLPQTPKPPPLDYQLVFSVEGLINEYVEPARGTGRSSRSNQ